MAGKTLNTKDDMVEQATLGDPGLFRKLIRPQRLESIFLFVTSRCNSKCKTCFYGARLNDNKDMPLEGFLKLAQTSPPFDKLWLSGGEPTLQDDLPEIVTAFVKHAGISVLNFPTNGLLPDRVLRMLDEIFTNNPELSVNLSFSLDGFEKTHDYIRGVPGGFKKTVDTIHRVLGRFGANPKLHINVATVITPQSYDEIEDLGWWVLKNLDVEVHFFEAVRGNPVDPSVKTITSDQLKALHKRVMPIHEAQANKMFSKLPNPLKTTATTSYLGVIQFLYKVHEANIESPHPWPMPCVAGKTTLVVEHDGTFRACELRRALGNVRDYSYDVRAIMHSSVMQDEIRQIDGGKTCWCTHSCWIFSSLKFSPRAMLTQIPISYLEATSGVVKRKISRTLGQWGGLQRGG